MKLLRHPVAALVLVAVLTTLFITIYTGLEDHYGITKGDLHNITRSNGTIVEGNLADQFKEMNLISGIEDLQTGIIKLKPPTGSNADLLGGLALVAVGAIKTIIGTVTIPFEMVHIITVYYAGEIPGILADLAMMIVVYVTFILLSAKVGKDI